MDNEQVKSVLQLKLGFTKENLRNLELLHDYLLKTNKEYNLISKSTENSIWSTANQCFCFILLCVTICFRVCFCKVYQFFVVCLH